jgi:geranylgeranyl diphosphate synthase, type II
MNLPADLDHVRAMFDQRIDSFIASKGFPANLYDAISYAVLGGGKRLRPALAWYSSIACNGTGDDTLDAGVALELIHAFSLVHDDLPALDDDALRRGRPTLHIHTNEPMAILAGDAMLSLAYEAVLGCGDDTIAQQLLLELTKGTRSMIVGQVFDTLGGLPEDAPPETQLELIHRNKTGALLAAACRMGAICGGATDRQLELITRFAHALGLQFQVVDDLLDIEGSPEAVGKALGKDQIAGKMTYPGVLGVERSKKRILELSRQADQALIELDSCTDGSVESLKNLAAGLSKRTM